LQRYKCCACQRIFNAPTTAPLGRLRLKEKWLAQQDALCQGLSVHQAAAALQISASTARWRHRFLRLVQPVMGVMNNGMSIMGIGIEWQQVIKGTVLLAAVVFDVYNRRKG